MDQTKLLASTALLLTAAAMVSCGGSSSPSGRVLLSISVSPGTANVTNAGVPVQFVATGTFSAAPYTVSPLPVEWQGNWSALPNYCVGDACVGISPTTGLALCGGTPRDVTILASAPSNPDLPLGTKDVPLVSGTAKLSCP
jgi:hypothetical protein